MSDTLLICLSICFASLTCSLGFVFWVLCRMLGRLSVRSQQESRQAFHLLERHLEWKQADTPELKNMVFRTHASERMQEVSKDAEVEIESVKANGRMNDFKRDEDLTDPLGYESIGV